MRVMKGLQKFILCGGLLTATRAVAHTGHGSSDTAFWHYLIEPVHLFGIVAAVLGVVGILFVLFRLRRHHH